MRSRNALAGLAMLVVALGQTSQTLWADNGPYTVQDAGPARGVALGVNASAVVVGTDGAAAPRTAFLTLFGSGSQLLSGSGSTDDVAFGVHPDGWAVGHSTSGFFTKPVSFQSGSAADLAPSAMMGAARAVNASGAIAGWVVDARGSRRSSGPMAAGLDVPGTFYAQAFALNDAGVVTGTFYNAGDNTLRAFTWSAGGAATMLPTLGGNTSEGNGINNQGDVVGDSFRTASARRDRGCCGPRRAESSIWARLAERPAAPATSTTTGRSSATRSMPRVPPRAFLSEAGAAMVDLNTLLPPASGWVLLSANAINDAGQIVGEGTFNDEPRAFLLTPPVASDTTPPVVSSVTTTPNSIWPPKHQMVDVTVGVVASDDSGETPVCAVLSVVSSESDNAGGDGNTSSDTEVVGPSHVRVRAERSGPSAAAFTP